MTAVDELRQDPRAFIRHYLLRLDPLINEPAPNQLRANGTVLMTLTDVTNDYTEVSRWRNRQGLPKLYSKITGSSQEKATRFYKVTPTTALGGPDTFAAYICPYRQDAALGATLSDAANFMFTAEMTGCSFGVGMAASDGSIRVMHVNNASLALPNSTAPQEAAQLAALQQEGLGSGSTLQPGDYREVNAQGRDTRATTIGLRLNGKWEFWYQNYNFDGGGYFLIETAQIR
jgi:hypothetical protein